MKNIKTYTGTLKVIKKMGLSYLGNPRYLCIINDIEFCTVPNSSYGYSITNYDNKNVTLEIGTHYNRLQLNNIID